MTFNVKKKLLTLHGLAAIGLGLLAVPASSYAGRAECMNMTKLATKIAEVRDSGARWEDIFAAFKRQRETGQIGQSDYEYATFALKFVYTGGEEYSPAQIQKHFTKICKEYQ